ncbi:MAG: hypothetical protein R3B70_43630 [Polyangiaceae bacterium]
MSLADLQRETMRGLAASDADLHRHEREGDGDDDEDVYRSLVRASLAGMIRFQLARTALHLGARFDRDIARFLDAGLPRSRYLRDVGFAFFAAISPAWEGDPEIPVFANDLARWELLSFDLTSAPDDLSVEHAEPLALDRRVRLSSSARLFRAQHAVHLLPEDDLACAPKAEPTALCVYRDAAFEQRTLALTPAAAAILERLLAGTTLGDAVSGAAAERGVALDPAFLQGAARVLEDLTERGVVRGPMGAASAPGA